MNSVDHAAEARELLENYAPDYTVAQVHATLALVEQQRLANLIAWTTRNGGTPLPEVADVIAERLGL